VLAPADLLLSAAGLGFRVTIVHRVSENSVQMHYDLSCSRSVFFPPFWQRWLSFF